MKFKIGGKFYEFGTMSTIINKMRDINPEPIRKYYVNIDGKKFPIKQVIFKNAKPEIHKIGFTSMYAYHILVKLGFNVFQAQE